MTYDPNRYEPYRYDPYSNEPPRDLDDYSGGVAILVGALLLAALGGFIYFASPSDQAYDIRPPITQPSTTGAGPAPERSSANMPPATPPKVNSVE